jgi:hypothetical protein
MTRGNRMISKTVSCAVLGAVAVALVSGCSSKPAAATETFTSKPMTYSQIMSSGNSTTFDLTYHGPVVATGSFSTGGEQPARGQQHVFRSSDGNLTVTVTSVPESLGDGKTPVALSVAACRYGAITRVDYKLDPTAKTTTGIWKTDDATGTGSVEAYFAFTLPKIRSDGKTTCNLSSSAQPLRSPAPAASFDGTIRITLK